MGSLIAELRRRNVFRVAGVYLVTGWLLAQAAVVLETASGLPEWFDAMVVALLLLGFPVALIFAWAFELTPEGLTRSSSGSGAGSLINQKKRSIDYAILTGIVLVAGLIVYGYVAPDEKAAAGAAGVEPERAEAESIDAEVGAANGAPPRPDNSIAVLPFEDFSANGDQAYFAEGVAEEILNVLAQMQGLRVTSRTSSFTFASGEASMSRIGEALNVAHVLEGSVRKAGDTVRVTAQLIDTRNDRHLWSQTYDRALTAENLFAIQDEISSAIGEALKTKLGVKAGDSSVGVLTENTEAYDAYLAGKALLDAPTEENVRTSVRRLERAVALDPEFARAHAALTSAYNHLALNFSTASDEARRHQESGDRHMARALDLAPDDPVVLRTQASNMLWRAPPDTVLALIERVLEKNPNDSRAYALKTLALVEAWRADDALEAARRAEALDPLSPRAKIMVGQSEFFQGSWLQAKQHLLEALALTAEDSITRWILGVGLESNGETLTAHRVLRSAGNLPYAVSATANLYARLGVAAPDYDSTIHHAMNAYLADRRQGKTSAAARTADAIVQAWPRQAFRFHYLLGNYDRAIAALEQSSRFGGLILGDQRFHDFADVALAYQTRHALTKIDDPRASKVADDIEAFETAYPDARLFALASRKAAVYRLSAAGRPDAAVAYLRTVDGVAVPNPWVEFDPLLRDVR